MKCKITLIMWKSIYFENICFIIFFLEFFLRTLLREQIYIFILSPNRETGSAERTRTQLGVLNTATTSLEYITRNWNQHFILLPPCQVFCYPLVKFSVTHLSSFLLPPWSSFLLPPWSSFLLPPCQVFCYPLGQVFCYPLVKFSVTPLSSILLPPCQVFCYPLVKFSSFFFLKT